MLSLACTKNDKWWKVCMQWWKYCCLNNSHFEAQKFVESYALVWAEWLFTNDVRSYLFSGYQLGQWHTHAGFMKFNLINWVSTDFITSIPGQHSTRVPFHCWLFTLNSFLMEIKFCSHTTVYIWQHLCSPFIWWCFDGWVQDCSNSSA